jgi:serpin B
LLLADMGLESLRTYGYEYFGLPSSRGPTRILRILQESKIKVNEGGTEAASSTAVIGGGNDAAIGEEDAGPVCQPRHFILDRPFFYLIRETLTGSILFMGKFVG